MDRLDALVTVFCPPDACSTQRAAADAAAKATGLDCVTALNSQFYLQQQAGKWGLYDATAPKQHPVVVDFLSAESLYRQRQGSRQEAVVKAIGAKGSAPWHVLDATPGLGRDAFVLASAGCHVTLVERHPVVAWLLADGLARLAIAQPDLAARLQLLQGNSITMMHDWQHHAVNAVYLDPMFPHRKKSALVKKEMRVFQQLVGSDPDADALLPSALTLASQRVVVKRPNTAPPLGDNKVSMSVTSKKHRFDVYLIVPTTGA